MRKASLPVVIPILAALIATAAAAQISKPAGAPSLSPQFQATWSSLRNNRIPQWLREGKFGIYTHWGVYAVPAVGPNATWYSNHLYMNPNSPERAYHELTYGPLTKFGYKDFIPMFKAEKFNAGRMGRPLPAAPAPGSPGRWPSTTTASPCGTAP